MIMKSNLAAAPHWLSRILALVTLFTLSLAAPA
jgi:hypothetical protein